MNYKTSLIIPALLLASIAAFANVMAPSAD